MATVEGYDLHLYCDHKGCGSREEVYGVDKADAYRNAREMGWHIGRKDSQLQTIGGKFALCPVHSGKKDERKLAPGERMVPLSELTGRIV